jgi:hypothetical protein
VCCWARREPRQAAKHDPLTYLTYLNLVISLGVSMLMLIFIYCIVDPTFELCPFLISLPCPCHVLLTIKWSNERLVMLRFGL